MATVAEARAADALTGQEFESDLGGKWVPLKTDADMVCLKLVEGLCSVYEDRPMLCRLWGLVEGMKCQWGCVPERYLTDREGREFLRAVAGAVE